MHLGRLDAFGMAITDGVWGAIGDRLGELPLQPKPSDLISSADEVDRAVAGRHQGGTPSAYWNDFGAELRLAPGDLQADRDLAPQDGR